MPWLTYFVGVSLVQIIRFARSFWISRRFRKADSPSDSATNPVGLDLFSCLIDASFAFARRVPTEIPSDFPLPRLKIYRRFSSFLGSRLFVGRNHRFSYPPFLFSFAVSLRHFADSYRLSLTRASVYLLVLCLLFFSFLFVSNIFCLFLSLLYLYYSIDF